MLYFSFFSSSFSRYWSILSLNFSCSGSFLSTSFICSLDKLGSKRIFSTDWTRWYILWPDSHVHLSESVNIRSLNAVHSSDKWSFFLSLATLSNSHHCDDILTTHIYYSGNFLARLLSWWRVHSRLELQETLYSAHLYLDLLLCMVSYSRSIQSWNI